MNAAMTQFKQYLQRRYPGSSTTKHYMSDLNIFSRFVGDVSPKDITPKLIDQFIQEQSQQGKSAATINRRLSSLSSFIDFLIDSQLKEKAAEEQTSKEEIISLIDNRLEEAKEKEQQYTSKEEVLSLIDSRLKEEAKGQQYASKEEILPLVESQLKEEAKARNYATREEIQAFEQDIKSLLKTFLEFFVSYGLELGKKSPKAEFEELSSKLEELENHLNSEGESKEAKIKWK